MTDAPKPTLTEAEQRALFSAYTEDSITALRDVIETVKADAWAAARREALLEAADAYSEFEVYIDSDGLRSIRQHHLSTPEWIRKHAAALTEPERDEEGR